MPYLHQSENQHGETKEDSGGYFCERCGLPPETPECPGYPPAYLNNHECEMIADFLEYENNPFNHKMKQHLTKRLRALAAYKGCRWRILQKK